MANKRTRARKAPPGRGEAGRRRPPTESGREARAEYRETVERGGHILRGARVYLSGPMDFVASREEERRNGWRTRVGQFLRARGVTVYDPWNKPTILGLPEYGKEDEFTAKARDRWTFEDSPQGDKVRAEVCDLFWPTLHTDLRMVDTTDFLVAYCPTNVYSVGTPHEIAMARLQHKPVLFVSPPVHFPALEELKRHLEKRKDPEGRQLLDKVISQAPLHDNQPGTPSLWYMALIDGSCFFDGFGFAPYFERFPEWRFGALDEREKDHPPRRPLLPYLEKLDRELPTKYDLKKADYLTNDDWLIMEAGDFT
jgi:hypothetical protein